MAIWFHLHRLWLDWMCMLDLVVVDASAFDLIDATERLSDLEFLLFITRDMGLNNTAQSC